MSKLFALIENSTNLIENDNVKVIHLINMIRIVTRNLNQ